jgi:hypothetical protein
MDATAAEGLFKPVAAIVGDEAAPDVCWAADYFIASWMGRGGQAGTAGEFEGGMSVRWSATGGDSCRRFRSATETLDAWCTALRDWNFVTVDAFEFLETVKDLPSHGLYLDPPWPGPGDGYRHTFGEREQRALAKELAGFENTRVVVRYGEHPLIREIYPASRWNWIRQTSKSQAGGAVEEVLILNGPSFAEAA